MAVIKADATRLLVGVAKVDGRGNVVVQVDGPDGGTFSLNLWPSDARALAKLMNTMADVVESADG